MKIIEKYENLCNEIVLEFAKKQDLIFDYWIANNIGGIADLNNFTFDMQEMIFDLKTKQPKGKIIDYQNYIIENTLKNEGKDYNITYDTYCKGFRF